MAKVDLIYELLKKANISSMEGYPSEALGLLESAEKLAIETKRDDLLAVIHGISGGIHTNLGDFENAKKNLEESLNYFESFLGIHSFSDNCFAGIERNLGYLLKNYNRYEEAKKNYIDALRIFEKLLKKDSTNILYLSQVIITLEMLADLLKEIGQFEDATQNFERVQKLEEELQRKAPGFIKYPLDITGILINNPKYFIIYGGEKIIEFNIERFLVKNHKLFTIMSVFGALSIYLNNIYTNPNEFVKIGVVSSLLLFIMVAIKILQKADVHNLKTIFTLSDANLYRIIFIIPFLFLVLSISYYIYSKLMDSFIYVFNFFIFIFGLIIFRYFENFLIKLYFKLVDSGISDFFIFILVGFLYSIPTILLAYLLNNFKFLNEILAPLLVSNILVFIYLILRLQNIPQYAKDYCGFQFNLNYINTNIRKRK